MRKFTLPHTVRWVAVCLCFFSGSLIFQGCKDASEEADELYAEFDAAFPNGRVDVERRTQDKEYMAKISEGAEKISSLADEVSKCEAKLAHLRNEIRNSIALKTNADVSDAILEAELAEFPLYQEALAQHAAAVAAVEAQRQENLATVRNRIKADAEAYDAKLAEVDAKVRALGVPTREELRQQATPTAEKTTTTKKKTVVPTAEELSKQTGIPLAPTSGK